MFRTLLLIIALMSFCQAQTVPATGDLKIVVNGIKNNNGTVYISLFNNPDGFPMDTKKVLKSDFSKISNNKAEFTLKNVAFGNYAIAVFHDENDNKVIDTKIFGIPKEGVGVSNNAKGRFGPPKYEDAKFSFSKSGQILTITMTYL